MKFFRVNRGKSRIKNENSFWQPNQIQDCSMHQFVLLSRKTARHSLVSCSPIASYAPNFLAMDSVGILSGLCNDHGSDGTPVTLAIVSPIASLLLMIHRTPIENAS